VKYQSLAVVVAGLGAALLTPAAPATAAEPAICHVDYRTYGDAQAFSGLVVIANTSPVVLYSWTLNFSLPAGQALIGGWAADFAADGQEVTAQSLPYNSVVAPTKSVAVGFRATGDGRAARPAEFRVNDHVCTTG
jgi:Cellulose binding domain